MSGQSPQYILKCGKCWQAGNSQLIWQVDVVHLADGRPDRDKAFLVVDATQQTRGIRLIDKKPEALQATGALAAKLRKLASTLFVSELFVSADQSISIPLRSHPDMPPHLYLLLDNAKPPLLSLLTSDQQNVMRIGQSGTYTKAKSYEGNLPPQTPWSSTSLPSLPGFEEIDAAATATEAEPGHDPALRPQRELAKRLARKLKTLRKSEATQQRHVPKQGDPEQLAWQAKLLQQYLYRIKPGMFALQLDAAETGGEPLTIPLDPELEPGANLDALFIKAKRARHAVSAGNAQLASLHEDIAALEADIQMLRASTLINIAMQERIAKRHHLKSLVQAPTGTGKSIPKAMPYRVFVSSLQYKILVGKSAADNDQLVKNAKSNDYWYHTVSGTGSHVIVPFVKALANGVPSALEREAAILALHYSPHKDSFGGEVYRSRKQFLRKRKGMAAGLWTIERSESFFVKYSDRELQEIFARQES